MERMSTVGRVAAAGRVAQERMKTGGRVVVAGCVVEERNSTGGRVAAAGGVDVKSALRPVAVLLLPVVLL